ncbi:MAG: nifV [Firmicutes bacterium]|nr:nifV [Bacillota bacterium]
MSILPPLQNNKPVYIVDTTLRDGEQAPGVVFTLKEKVRIAQMLDEIGVDQLEAGTPIMGGDEAASIYAIAHLGLHASIMAWCRAQRGDVDAALACGVDALEISAPTSDLLIRHKLNSSRQEVLENMQQVVRYAKQHGVYVSVGAEDTTRSEEAFVIQYALAAQEAGADRLRYCDTVGTMDPFTLADCICRIRQKVSLPIEIHTHNDFGLATANTLAAFRAGATFLSTTATGLGERSGNAALEEILMALKHLFKVPIPYNLAKLSVACHFVAAAAKRSIAPDKPIIGSALFCHESGIHADATLKNTETYEPFAPEEIGLSRQLIIGKHSGSSAIQKRFADLGICLNKDTARKLIDEIRCHAIKHKTALSDQDLLHIYQRWHPAE